MHMEKNEDSRKKVKPLPDLTRKHERPTYVPKKYSRDVELRSK